MSHARTVTAMLVCLALLGGAAAGQSAKDKAAPPKLATEGAIPEIGEITLDHTFRKLVNGDGRTSMKDFRGSVVLVDWWGYH